MMFTSSEVKVKAVVMNKLVGRGNVDMENRCVGKKIRKGIHQLFACEASSKTYFDILFVTVVVKLLVILQMLCCGNLLL